MTEEKMSRVVLRNPEFATVDGVTLEKDRVDEPTELTEDQITRLRVAPDVKLEVLERDQDPIDALKGESLEKEFRRSGITLEGNASADDKRRALKLRRDNQEGGGS